MALSRHSSRGRPRLAGTLALLKRFGKRRDNAVADAVREAFDPVFYLAENPDVARRGADPLLHFCNHGWREGRDPNANFSVKHYLLDHPDVADSGMNPFYHFIIAGKNEGRATRLSGADFSADLSLPPDARAISAFFDGDFYLAKNEDVAKAGLDPLLHYCGSGWHEGRDPAPDFSTRFYLDSNPDVAQSGMNPFHHYVIAGRAEGRAATHPGGYKVDILRQQIPLERMAEFWRCKREPEADLSGTDLAKLLRKTLAADREAGKTAGLILSVGHDHYRQNSGGVQLSIQREELIARDAGFTYFNVHPWSAQPRLAHNEQDSDPLLTMVLNGEDAGVCRSSALADALKRLRSGKEMPLPFKTVVHHMMGHSTERLAEIITAGSDGTCWVWLHDFFTICPSFALQRNNVTFCGAPPPGSNACSLCLYGAERQLHVARLQRLLASVKARFIAPSEAMREMWLKALATAAPGGIVPEVAVVPHVTLSFEPRETPLADDRKQLTIGFIGAAVPYKGWPVFAKLLSNLQGDDRYRFVYFGRSAPGIGGLDHISVEVTAERPDAMIEALEDQAVDLVLHWAACFETFSLSTYEAVAAGAGVITNPGSGNVATVVLASGRGKVLDDVSALLNFFDGPGAAELAEDLRRRTKAQKGAQHASRLTLGLIEEAGI